jgi:hypothetical protein
LALQSLQPGQRLRVAGTDEQHLIIEGARLVLFAQIEVSESQRKVGVVVERVEVDYLLEVAGGFVKLLAIQINDTQ